MDFAGGLEQVPRRSLKTSIDCVWSPCFSCTTLCRERHPATPCASSVSVLRARISHCRDAHIQISPHSTSVVTCTRCSASAVRQAHIPPRCLAVSVLVQLDDYSSVRSSSYLFSSSCSSFDGPQLYQSQRFSPDSWAHRCRLQSCVVSTFAAAWAIRMRGEYGLATAGSLPSCPHLDAFSAVLRHSTPVSPLPPATSSTAVWRKSVMDCLVL